PAASAEAKESKPKFAFVLLAKPRLPDGKDLLRAFAPFASKDCQLRVDAASQKKEHKNDSEALVFDLTPDGHGFIGLMPTPVPKREADEAAAYSVHSITQGRKLPPHAAHLIVSLTDPATPSTVDRFAPLYMLTPGVDVGPA